MPRLLAIRNRQRRCSIERPFLRQIARCLLIQHLGISSFELCLHLVDDAEMARINWQFLQHEGTTDVITFDHSSATDDSDLKPGRPPSSSQSPALHGEIFLCLGQALAQATQFRTTWQLELTRYLSHGILHLCGYDDRGAPARRHMKKVENRLVRQLAAAFPLAHLGRRPAPPGNDHV